jgi:hypothetical protein
VKKDVFLNALLEMPTTKQQRRSPLQWAGAMGLHVAIEETPLVAPPPSATRVNLSLVQSVSA